MLSGSGNLGLLAWVWGLCQGLSKAVVYDKDTHPHSTIYGITDHSSIW